MFLKIFPSGPFATNAYFIGCENTNQGIYIDPAPDSAELLHSASEGFNVQGIYLTHSHWDHIGDVAKLMLPVFVHALDAANLMQPGSDGLPMMMPITAAQPTGHFEDGEQFQVGDLIFDVIHTPGHTPGGVCFYLKQENILISGDTLFKGSIGNISFPTADPSAMWQSLKKLAKLPAQTCVYPGHGEPTSIGAEPWLEQAEEIFG